MLGLSLLCGVPSICDDANDCNHDERGDTYSDADADVDEALCLGESEGDFQGVGLTLAHGPLTRLASRCLNH